MNNCQPIFSGYISARLYLIVVVLLLVFLIPTLLKTFESKIDRILLGILGVAGLVNLFDRLEDGCIFDPFNFFGLFHFNIPDLIVTCLSLTLFVKLIIKDS